MLEGLLLDELPAFFLPVAIPVVVPFFMSVCLVVLLVAPGPTFPSLDAPGAGCALCERAPGRQQQGACASQYGLLHGELL
jgi:hypothetical protein